MEEQIEQAVLCALSPQVDPNMKAQVKIDRWIRVCVCVCVFVVHADWGCHGGCMRPCDSTPAQMDHHNGSPTDLISRSLFRLALIVNKSRIRLTVGKCVYNYLCVNQKRKFHGWMG